jgi:hypothetical protein
MTNTTTENKNQRPYNPSWIDRFTDWVETLPIQAWLFYTSCGFVLILIQLFFLWLDGGLGSGGPLEILLPIIIFNALLTPLAVGMIHLLDKQAVTALNTMRPTLDLTGPEISEFQYRISTMPFARPMIIGLALLVSLLITEELTMVPARFAALDGLPIFTVVFQIADKVPAIFFGVFFYHTYRQLRLVNTINMQHTQVSLFNLGPLRAFSTLTATTAVGLIIGVYGWMLINPDLLSNQFSLGAVVVLTTLAVFIFIWPQYGIHRRMQMEKEKALHEIEQRFEAVYAKFNQRFSGIVDAEGNVNADAEFDVEDLTDDDFAHIQRLNGIIASLEVQHKSIRIIPTWPWRPDTARYVLTAIALPLILWTLQFFIAGLLDR